MGTEKTLLHYLGLIGIFLTDIQIIYSLDFTDFIPKGLRGGS